MTAPTVVPCLQCGHPFDEHSGVTDLRAAPKDGDLSLCWRCAAPAVFTVSPLGVLGLRPPTPAEERELMRHPYIRAALDARDHVVDPRAAAALAHRVAGSAGPT